jgi:hypothetical protein
LLKLSRYIHNLFETLKELPEIKAKQSLRSKIGKLVRMNGALTLLGELEYRMRE